MSDDQNAPNAEEQASEDQASADQASEDQSSEMEAPGYEEMEDHNDQGQSDTSQDFDVGEPMANDVTAIYDIPVQISAVLGRSSMQVSQLLKLGRGAVVELDRKVGEAIDIYVNNRLVARGEVVVVEDKLGVTMTEIVKSDRS